ncbi:uncharacterized protein LOC122733501 [Dromiciops gliroides]|uniref:uncharacterized protein LOC122733501 n=1 Tax=Dromiciops gliroides TaxID=33562 RepID=UPI001CC6AB20|nr:uncharacterized protein LOC122733501 [Dromiciops gliroides]
MPLQSQKPEHRSRRMRALLDLLGLSLLLCCAAGFSSLQESKQDWRTLRRPRSNEVMGSNEVPWLVSVAGVCQGVVLSRWWVLSTASCLRNINSGLLPVRGSGTWLNGSWICLHPNFMPSAGTITAQSDLGMIFLHQPARLAGGQVHLARDTSKARKNCPFCGHRPCHIYQRQNPQKPGLAPAKRMAVKLLGSWACHHLGAHPTETERLCIWSDPWPGPDCWVHARSRVQGRGLAPPSPGSHTVWGGRSSRPGEPPPTASLGPLPPPPIQVQPGSPVLCRFGNHWELVGLVTEPMKVCYVPILAVRTAPYLSWMDAVIQDTQKQPLSLPCNPSAPSSPDSGPWAHLPIPGSGVEVMPQKEASSIDSSMQTQPAVLDLAPGIGGGGKAERLPSDAKFPIAATWLFPEHPAEPLLLPGGALLADNASSPTGEPHRQFPHPVSDPTLVQEHSPPNKARSLPQQGEHPTAARPKTRLATEPAGPQTRQAEKPVRSSVVPRMALTTPQAPQPAAAMGPRAVSQTPLASRSRPHLVAETGRSPHVSKAHAARPQTHSAPAIMRTWLLPETNRAKAQPPPAVLPKPNSARPRARPASGTARPCLVPKAGAPHVVGPWLLLKTGAAGWLTQPASDAARPWVPSKIQHTLEPVEPQILLQGDRSDAAPLPQPAAGTAGLWAVPATAVDAIVPWAGPVAETASEAIIPWAGPAPARALAPSVVPGPHRGAHLLPSPAPLSSGSLAYRGPFLSPRFFPSSQSQPPAPAHAQPALFSGAMQALAWGPSGPLVAEAQQSSSLSHASFSSSPLPPPIGPSQLTGPVQSEELPLRVTLAQCRLGLGWRSTYQAYWLFQTALFSQRGIRECGTRPGFAAQCPDCWEAEEGEFPWVVSLQLSLSHFCSGSILNEWWILTTASCANMIRNSESLARVQAGVINLEDQVRAQLVGIRQALPYFGLQGPVGLGLLLLREPLRFQPRALAVCLEESPEKPVPEPPLHLYDCWVPGWTLIKGNLATMQKQRLNVVEVSKCGRYWPMKSSMAFCVEAKKVMGQNSCKGDLGAPLMCRPKLRPEETPWVQMGILTAFDEACTRPYVFSRIRPFIFWLRASTKPQHPPWARPARRPTLSSLPKPEALVNRISLRFVMPWQALIVTCGRQICAGSILSPSWVLTSAHCIRDMRSENMAVFLGLPQPGGNLTAARVSSVVLHEQYRAVNGVPRNDLALILLQQPLGPTQPLAPVGRVDDVNKAECWLTGPRELREGETDQYPQALQVQVKDALSCAHLFPGIRSPVLCLRPQLPEFQMALDLVGSGSALLCRSRGVNGTWRQTGLTSIKSLSFLLTPYFSWISKTSSVQTNNISLSQSVPVVSTAVAGPRGPLNFFPLLTLCLEFLLA